MPYNDPDPTDPNILVGVVLPANPEAERDMAYVFAEEFARMGYDRERLLALFKTPFYAGAYGAYRALGEEAIRSIIDECLNAWGHVRFSSIPSISSVSSSGPSDGHGRNDQTDQVDEIDNNRKES